LRSIGPVAALLLFVRSSSAPPVEPVRQDGSFAEKQLSYGALLFLVRRSSEIRLGADSCSRGGSMRHVVLRMGWSSGAPPEA
jgi:hypothetical protein